MKWNHNTNRILSILLPILFASQALAYDEPPVNLGYTSFLDGIPPSGPGWYLQDYLQYYTANTLNDGEGNELPFPNTNFDATVNVLQILYLSKTKMGNASWAFNVMLPWLMETTIDDGLNNAVLKAQTGLGDIMFGPALQFDPIMGPNGPIFSHRFEFDIIAPTGEYDPNYTVNPGSNFWSINPYWAATLWFTPNWSASTRIHYLWNGNNDEPNVSFGPDVTSTQAGQAIFANITTEYKLSEKFFLGINGYFFNQITDTEVNDQDVSGRQEFVWAIGPGALFSFTKNDFLFFNTYFEQDAENRPEGFKAVLRYVHHF